MTTENLGELFAALAMARQEFGTRAILNMVKLCECGCGQPTAIAQYNDKRRGHIKGQPVRCVVGHHVTKTTPRDASAKLCPKCQQVLPIDAFQKCNRDGYQARCRQCRLEDQREHTAQQSKRNKRWRQANRDKQIAHNKVANAIKRGRLLPAYECICERCGNQAEHYHHATYNKPLEVTPVCSGCHKLIHLETNHD